MRFNIGKRSASVRFGGKGYGYTAGTSGQRVSANLRGTGLSYSEKIGGGLSGGAVVGGIVLLVLIVLMLALL